jgi:hypothetical protein
MNFWTGFMLGQAGHGNGIEKIVITRTTPFDEYIILFCVVVFAIMVIKTIYSMFFKKHEPIQSIDTGLR